MNFSSFLAADGSPVLGVMADGQAHDLGPSGLGLAPGLRAAIAGGLLAAAAERYRDAPARPEEDVTFLPVVPDPAKILCIGVNYREHQEETGHTEHKAPTIFTRFADSQTGHLRPALMPGSSSQFDYEGELALVIGRPAFHVAEHDAWSCIAGYAAYDDFSARDWQFGGGQWTPGKNFAGTGSFGPYLVPADGVGDVSRLDLETRVNGEVRQRASVADLVFTIPQLIAHITGFTPLAPGDVVVTGTPGGAGMFTDPPSLLSPGDVVEVEITGLGTLRNTVAVAH